jgi:protoporphyrinogen oxidase
VKTVDAANRPLKRIAVVGGGVTGIAAAMRLSQSKEFKVTLFEAAERLGGLSSYYQWEDVIWDRFYHVILSTDTVFLNLIQELGLNDRLFWRDTQSGFFGDNRLVSMSSTVDFLRFPFMSLWQKFRMGLGILYCSRIQNATKLDRIYAREWLTRIFGRRVYESIWEPLLRSKLGAAREKTSAAFIWATINRLYGARQNSGSSKKEQMGHVHGGYHTILSAAEKRLLELGVELKKGTLVEKIIPHAEVGARPAPGERPVPEKARFSLHAENQDFDFDNVLLTVDCPKVLKLVDGSTDTNQSYWRNLKNVDYLGVVCLFLVMRHQLSPYYVINLLDKELPFTGIIEATNVVSPADMGGKHIVYLPKYVTRDDPVKSKSDEEIKTIFFDKLRKVYPHLNNQDILHSKVFRAEYVQPLQEIDFLGRSSSMNTPIDGLYIVNTSMIYNSTLNNNAAANLALKAAKTIIDDNRHQPF